MYIDKYKTDNTYYDSDYGSIKIKTWYLAALQAYIAIRQMYPSYMLEVLRLINTENILTTNFC